ncbi:MAG: hypothetical protein HC882_07045, partial [Acidobacteria bacterium]|nr:hypothetical protein [Acidobacteriota bacterium]
GDGLSTVFEFQAGLDPVNPDTDGDGLQDGREVNGFGTNPLLFDTDGDRISDGLEVTAGSDPLDRLSVNLAPILADFDIDPASFTIIYNTVLGEGSRRVTVTARLIDGTEINATGAPYGTTWRSSDLTVASFGSEAGRVYAGADGSAVVTAENGAFSATAAVRVMTFAPTALSVLRLPGAANAIALDRDFAYVAVGGAGLAVVDVSNPLVPRSPRPLDFRARASTSPSPRDLPTWRRAVAGWSFSTWQRLARRKSWARLRQAIRRSASRSPRGERLSSMARSCRSST